MRRVTATRVIATLAVTCVMGCGSLSPRVLFASAKAEYPDCDDVQIAESDEGRGQWLLVCGERRLFVLRAEEDVLRERAARGLRDDERLDAILRDGGPPLEWSATRALGAAHGTTSVTAALRPLRVFATLIGIGESSYLVVERPDHGPCAEPSIDVGTGPRTMQSAPTESRYGTWVRFVQRLDGPTVDLLASQPVSLTHCGERYGLDPDAAAQFRQWASERRPPER